MESLEILQDFFKSTLPEGARPQLVFHGAEPLLAKDAVFAGIEKYGDYFRFGVQTNATLLDQEAKDFLVAHGVGIGLSLDGPTAAVADRTRRTWGGDRRLRRNRQGPGRAGGLSRPQPHHHGDQGKRPVICRSWWSFSMPGGWGTPCSTRCGGPNWAAAISCRIRRSWPTFSSRPWTGPMSWPRRRAGKLVIGNFANLLLGLVAPGARRLMCDISPCGGGRCFFAVGAHGEVAPCSEFLGLPEFHGGNLWETSVPELLATPQFNQITTRVTEGFAPCNRCAVRHFCGAPCPAEVYAINGRLDAPAPLCDFYTAQAQYAFRVIAQGRLDDYLWDGWKDGLEAIVVM